jgi:glycosyltransferase involved in cell wall biosynthesis
MPAYNAEKWIERAIISVMNQSYKNYELIIIDDGSTDNTYSVIQKYVKSLNMKIHRLNHNFGVSVARNIGLSLCEGDIITFLDSDDELCPTALETIVNKFKSLPEDVAIIIGRTIDDYGNMGGIIVDEERFIDIKDWLCGKIIKKEAHIAVKRKVINNIKFSGKYFHHLSSFYLKIMKSAKAFAIPIVLCKYHNLTNPTSFTKIKRNIKLRITHAAEISNEILDFLAEFEEYLKKYCPKNYSQINLQLAIYSSMSGNRKIAIKALLKSLYYHPTKISLIWLLFLFLPTGFSKTLYQRLYSR